jgi:DNA-directed RNA polymerase specialized sigma24 family protein
MDLASAIKELPEAHAVALCLHSAVTANAEIAAKLGIEVAAVPPLLRLAKAKLARLLAAPEPREKGAARHTDHSS